MDVVVISEWNSRAELDAWWAVTDKQWDLHLMQTYKRSVAINLLAAFVIPSVLRLAALLKREHVDVFTESLPDATDEQQSKKSFTATRLHGFADSMLASVELKTGRGNMEDGVLMMNWVKDGVTAADKASDQAYGLKVCHAYALRSQGCGCIV